jgi:hypothetical protein
MPDEEWEDLKKEILEKIDKIDKNTPWQDYEPKWWLEMMDIRKKIQKDTK